VKKFKIYGTVEDRTTGPRTQKTGPITKDIVSPRIQKLANQREDPSIDPAIAESETASNHYGKHFTSGVDLKLTLAFDWSSGFLLRAYLKTLLRTDSNS